MNGKTTLVLPFSGKIGKNKINAMKFKITVLVFSLILCCTFSFGQQNSIELKKQLLLLIKPYKATVGIALKLLKTSDTLTINNAHHYPMQSVYKFPLALSILSLADNDKLSLNQKVHINKTDLHKTWSPLKDKFPDGNIDLSVGELLQYSVSQSDNNACDILFKLAGNPVAVNKYIHGLGIRNMEIVATENEMHQQWDIQYKNFCTPIAMIKLLEIFYNGKYLSENATTFLLKLMTESSNSKMRLKGLLQEEIIVAHKTGSSGDNGKGLIAATNDVGIISLPNGMHLAIVVFVSDSKESSEINEKLIAEISKKCFDFYSYKMK